MIRDQYLRLVFIPILGLVIPMLSGMITYSRYSLLENAGATLYFIFISFIIWEGCRWIHGRMRILYPVRGNPFTKIFSICFLSGLYGALVACVLSLLWFRVSREAFNWVPVQKCVALSAVSVAIFTLVYEILFLSKERELDNKIVNQLDLERTRAEMSLLKNELEPHFIFNSLNTLSHLIIHDPPVAHAFNSKLAKVYKYFLINKDKDLISLRDELEFIENYFYLLQIRHDNKLRLNTTLGNHKEGAIMILPCALQILVENAIKHNEFSESHPLDINIVMNGQYLRISNNSKPKPYLVNSTKIGLRNLSSRYKLVCNKDIVIESTPASFTVKLPLIK